MRIVILAARTTVPVVRTVIFSARMTVPAAGTVIFAAKTMLLAVLAVIFAVRIVVFPPALNLSMPSHIGSVNRTYMTTHIKAERLDDPVLAIEPVSALAWIIHEASRPPSRTAGALAGPPAGGEGRSCRRAGQENRSPARPDGGVGAHRCRDAVGAFAK